MPQYKSHDIMRALKICADTHGIKAAHEFMSGNLDATGNIDPDAFESIAIGLKAQYGIEVVVAQICAHDNRARYASLELFATDEANEIWDRYNKRH